MNNENKFIKHIVETKKSVNDWPEWKRNLLGGDEISSKSFRTLANSESMTEKLKGNKK
ncbi:TPA: hypothetical protein ACX3KD_004687 [Raoultella ornithinolytica]|jgi:hypothetical protein|uniref:hypothetical protein n=1 Tax=Raoultella ornithinolytica TaxID=54291 RepID=UPI0015E079BB|nr:hypothetical protein [Raoultella ornithinolytica]EJD6313075.1 hypothetical protein [Raoultella ornithinolytica]MCF6660039.1 hypothetical protein [Raoultella ornithinolytica]WLP46501.1 hypothetical protein Q7A27_01475 [Raoultella ornithinolytica]HDH7797809.1 hypothetical protein [Raoultella ornithinolytica]HEC2550896.1 hypothetical protein [Raoultella ornithinolytica]